MNPLELDENPYYSKLVSITTENYKNYNFVCPTITVIVTMEEHEFKFEQQLDFMDADATKEEVEKYFNAEMLGQDIDLTDMKCWRTNCTTDLNDQMRDAYISPDC
jgi:hypothetical protein